MYIYASGQRDDLGAVAVAVAGAGAIDFLASHLPENVAAADLEEPAAVAVIRTLAGCCRTAAAHAAGHSAAGARRCAPLQSQRTHG